jgi:hypothetical protein
MNLTGLDSELKGHGGVAWCIGPQGRALQISRSASTLELLVKCRLLQCLSQYDR